MSPVNWNALLGAGVRDETDERLARKKAAGQSWSGWPGLISSIHVYGSTVVLEFPVNASDRRAVSQRVVNAAGNTQIVEHAITVGDHLNAASEQLSAVFGMPVLCVPRQP